MVGMPPKEERTYEKNRQFLLLILFLFLNLLPQIQSATIIIDFFNDKDNKTSNDITILWARPMGRALKQIISFIVPT